MLVAADSVNLTLNDPNGSPQVVPLDEIVRLERYDGQLGSFEGLRRGARRGFLIGLGTTTVLMVVSLVVPCQGECDMSPPQFAALVGVLLTAVTTTLGGIIGSQYRAVWTRLPIPGCPDIVQCGNYPEAKARVTELLRQWFGWQTVIDLGDITTSRGVEMILPIWLRLWGALGTPKFNFKIAR